MTTIESGSIVDSTSRQVWSRSRLIETTLAARNLKNRPTIGRWVVFAAAGTTPWQATRQMKLCGAAAMYSHSKRLV